MVMDRLRARGRRGGGPPGGVAPGGGGLQRAGPGGARRDARAGEAQT